MVTTWDQGIFKKIPPLLLPPPRTKREKLDAS